MVTPFLGHVVPRLFPSLAGSRHNRLSRIVAELNVMSTTYRYRLDAVPGGLSLSVISQALNVLVFFFIGKVLFTSRMTATLVQHFLMVPLTLFTMDVPLPFGDLGLTEGVGDQFLKLAGHPSGIGFRVSHPARAAPPSVSRGCEEHRFLTLDIRHHRESEKRIHRPVCGVLCYLKTTIDPRRLASIIQIGGGSFHHELLFVLIMHVPCKYPVMSHNHNSAISR